MKQIQIFPSITTIDSHSLKSYLNEVSRIPCLTPEEEANLASLIREGGKEGSKEGRQAKERLVVANLRFVISIAKMYQHAGMLLEDLINEGNIGLIKAADCFDPTLGFKFITYAVWHIRESIQRALVEKGGFVRISSHKADLQKKLKRTAASFMQRNQRQPSIAELSELLNETENRIKSAMEADLQGQPIDVPLREDREWCLNDMLAASKETRADYQTDRESLAIELNSILKNALTDREREVLVNLFGIGCSAHNLSEVSSMTGICIERIRQIRERALLNLRMSKSTNRLRKYL